MRLPRAKTGTALLLLLLLTAFATVAAHAAGKKNSGSAVAVQPAGDIDRMRVEGERRFRANCGRCHAAPGKFPPRMMATVLRHMRVRATITDEDMRLVLFYMTQ